MVAYTQLTEPELFRLIAQSDEQAFAICFRRFTPPLLSYVTAIIHAESWAEDLVQNLFTKLWNNREALAAIDNPASYLFRMAANAALDFMRHNQVEVKAQYIISRDAQKVQAADSSIKSDFHFYAGLLQTVFHELPAQQQKVFSLRFEQGLSYEEIADKLNLSRNTVRNHLAAAVKTVRQYLVDHGEILSLPWVLFLV